MKLPSVHGIDARKATIYAEAGVHEYWIVEPGTRRITVLGRPTGKGYGQTTVYEGNQSVSCAVLPEFEVALTALFA